MRAALAPLESVWAWVQGRANPIVVKELRATVRQRRFLVIHFLAVALLATLVVAVVIVSAGEELATYRASEVGQALFYTCAMVQAILIVLLVPGMTAPALVEERANQSLDLLITTRLSPRQIVLGKLGASLVTVLLLLVSWMPLVAVTFLFGGVGMLEVVLLYVQLVASAVLLATLSLHCSAVERSPRRAVIYAYFLTFLVGGGFWSGAGALWSAQVSGGSWQLRQSLGTVNGVLLVLVAPAYFFLFLTGAFLLSAINRMKPASANRSTNMRLFLTLMAVLGFGCLLVAFLANVPPRPRDQFLVLGFYLVPATVVAMLAASIFATEEPIRFERLRRGRARLRGIWAPLRTFYPGPGSGAALALLLGLFLIGGGLAVARWAPGLALGPRVFDRLVRLGGLSLAAVFMSVGVAYALGAGVRRLTWSRFLFLVIVCGLLFGPLVSLVIRSGELGRRELLTSRLWHGDYLSGVVAAIGVASRNPWTMRGHEIPEEVQTPFGPTPLADLTLIAYAVIGLVGVAVGVSCSRRFEAGLPALSRASPPSVGGSADGHLQEGHEGSHE